MRSVPSESYPPVTFCRAISNWQVARTKTMRAARLARPFCFPGAFPENFLSARLQCHACESVETESTGCCRGEVDDAAAYERSPIIDPHHDAAAVAVVRHAHACAEGQRPVRSREAARLCALSACGAFAGIGIDRSDSGLRHDGGRTPNENQCAANRGGETHDHQLCSWIGPSVGRGSRWDGVRFGGGNWAIFRNQKFHKMWKKSNFRNKTYRWHCSYIQIRSDDEKKYCSALLLCSRSRRRVLRSPIVQVTET